MLRRQGQPCTFECVGGMRMGDGRMPRRRLASRCRLAFGLLWLLLLGMSSAVALAQQKTAEEDAAIAQSLAEMLRDARAIISNNQGRINDPEIGDKGLSAKVVLDQAVETYKKDTGIDPMTVDPASRHGRLLRAMMGAISEVMDANQTTINAKGIGFKAFIPAVRSEEHTSE